MLNTRGDIRHLNWCVRPGRPKNRTGLRQRTVGVPPVVDPQHDDLAPILVDPVEHPIGSAANGPYSGQVIAEGLADPMRVLEQHSCDEVDDGRRNRLGQFLCNRPPSRVCQNDLKGGLGHGR